MLGRVPCCLVYFAFLHRDDEFEPFLMIILSLFCFLYLKLKLGDLLHEHLLLPLQISFIKPIDLLKDLSGLDHGLLGLLHFGNLEALIGNTQSQRWKLRD